MQPTFAMTKLVVRPLPKGGQPDPGFGPAPGHTAPPPGVRCPSSPTTPPGLSVPPARLTRVHAAVPAAVLLVVDQAYAE